MIEYSILEESLLGYYEDQEQFDHFASKQKFQQLVRRELAARYNEQITVSWNHTVDWCQVNDGDETREWEIIDFVMTLWDREDWRVYRRA